LLVGLKGPKGDLLGIGILCNIDLKRRTIKVYTPVKETVKSIHIGEVRLSMNGKEIECPVDLSLRLES